MPPSRAQDELNAAYANRERRAPELEGVTVHNPDPSYGSIERRT